MTKSLLISLAVLCFWLAGSFSQGIGNDDKLRALVSEYGQADVTVPYAGRDDLNNLSRHLSLYAVKEKVAFISLSPLTLDWFINQSLDYQIIEPEGDKGLVSATTVSQAMEWETYPTYTQYDSIMNSFNTLYPSLCRLDTIGTSVNGRLVLALKISDNSDSDENEPEVFYTSSMHGDETGGYVLMLRLIDYLLKNYSSSPRIKNMVDNLEIWINPLANPDGTYRSGNVISSPVRYNANGVDLNRNFPDPLDLSIVVPKENADMIRFLRKHRFIVSANFHGGAEVVNYPWDRWYSKYHADDSWFNDISRAYADTVHTYSGTGYMTDELNGVTRGAVWYIIEGGRQDFVTWELQGREVTIELDATKITPAAQLGLLWLYNRNSLLGYLENALYGVHGQVKSAISSLPVPAKIFIAGHDKDSSHIYSDTLTGNFIRLLSPGSYSMTFAAEGYKDKIVNNIVVLSGQRTDIVIDMEPDPNGIESYVMEMPSLYPDPVTDILKALLPDRISGNINVKITSLSGRIMADYNTESLQGVPLLTDVSWLSGGIYFIMFTSNQTGNKSGGKFIVIK